MNSPSARIFRLYQWAHCSYCYRVRTAAERLGIELELIDTTRTVNAERRLITKLGRATVPVLSFDCAGEEQLLPESADIIRFLESYAAAGRPTDPCSLARP